MTGHNSLQSGLILQFQGIAESARRATAKDHTGSSSPLSRQVAIDNAFAPVENRI